MLPLSSGIIASVRIREYEDGTASQGWCAMWLKRGNNVKKTGTQNKKPAEAGFLLRLER